MSGYFDVVQAGDILVRQKGLFNHYAIGVGPNMVVHNTPEQGSHVGTPVEFANGQPFARFRPPLTESEKVTVAGRALQTLSQRYDLLSNNCEHTIAYAQSGIAQSPTVGAFLALAALGTIGYLVMRR